MESTIMTNDPEHKKFRYFKQLASENRIAFDVGKIGEIRAGDIEKKIIFRHEFTVLSVSDTLAWLFNLSEQERRDLNLAMSVHDFDKIYEKDEINIAIANGSLSFHTIMKIKEVSGAKLKNLGLNDNIIKLTGANIQEGDEPPDTLIEKIAWLSDSIVDGVEIVTISERFKRQLSNNNSPRNRAYFKALSYNGKTHDIVQQEIGHEICVEFSKKLGFTGNPDDLPLFIKEKFEERIINF